MYLELRLYRGSFFAQINLLLMHGGSDRNPSFDISAITNVAILKILKILLLLPFMGILLSASCKKAEKLTPETQTGANTFSCKINGVVFIPKKGDFVQGLTANLYNNTDLVILATGTQYKPIKEILISIKNVPLEGTYLLDFTQSRYSTLEIFTSSSGKYHSKTLNSGSVIIAKLDRTNRSISGHFNFVLSNENDPNDRVNITDGRFDVTY